MTLALNGAGARATVLLHPWSARGRCARCGAKRGEEREDEECPDRLREALRDAYDEIGRLLGQRP